MKRRIVSTVVAVLALTGLAVGVFALSGGPVSAAGPKVAPEPYQSAHAWAFSGTGTIPIPTGDRVVITDANLSIPGPDSGGCTASGEFNGSAVVYTFPSTTLGSATGNINTPPVWIGTSYYLDSGSPATASCGASGGLTLTGYTVPLG
jgi:hypothetical protein